MCGIIGYIGNKEAGDILIEGLQKLEYRGYDSAGICVADEKSISRTRSVGKVESLKEKFALNKHKGTRGIGHTRWATHGAPLEKNAHPHSDLEEKIYVAHNGVLENYKELKDILQKKGYTFTSDTDTEVIPHLINMYKAEGVNTKEAIIKTVKCLTGAYGLAVIDKDEECLYAVKNGSPLVLGIGDGEMYISSDEIPLIGKVENTVFLSDGDIAEIRASEYQIFDINNFIVEREVNEIQNEAENISKEGFAYFMEKEIFNQPQSIKDSMRGRISKDNNEIIFGGLMDHWGKVQNATSINFIACGTSYHAGMVAAYNFENITRVPSKVEYASEFLYRHPVIDKNGIYVAISQSGETKDLLSAIEYIKKEGGTVMGLVNVVGSSISRITDFGIHIHAGPEIGVASTKAFTSQTLLLSMLAIKLAKDKRTLTKEEYIEIKNEILDIPRKIQEVLSCNDDIKKLAEEHSDKNNTLFLGRGVDYPVALEGALKLKEISYVHAEGYPAAELKHGVIALIDKHMPSIILATKGTNINKVLGNVEEINARGGEIVIVSDEDENMFSHIPHTRINIPVTHPILTPILSTIPLQLYAYHSAVVRGRNVDQPRNLAKSVTVE